MENFIKRYGLKTFGVKALQSTIDGLNSGEINTLEELQ